MMKRGHTRLALPAAALLLSVACTSNAPEQAEPVSSQPGSSQEAQGTEQTLLAPGREAPPAAEQQAPDRAAAVPDSTPARPAPRPPAAPRAPRPAADSGAREARVEADKAEASAREAGRAAREASPDVTPEAPRPEPVRMVSIPADTRLSLVLLTDLASDTSQVEDRVAARVASDVMVDGETVIPEGSRVSGRVTYAQPSGKVKGRAGLTVRFHTLTVGSRTYDIVAEPFRREAEGTKAKDARNIGIGAGAGAVVGGIIGGRKGAAIGAGVGGAGGTGVVLATKGEEVRVSSGTAVSTRLSDPVVIQVNRGSR